MAKVKLENYKIHLKEQLKNKKFRRYYEFERAKVVLAQRIAAIREEEHLRQIDLAKRMEVSQQFISQIETAQEKNLTLDTLLKIARSLGRGIKISFPKTTGHTSYLKVL